MIIHKMEEKNEEENLPSITCLPNEVISLILQNNECIDILCFSSTCKRFNEMVNNDQYLWKEKFKCTMPQDIYEIYDKKRDGDWLNELKRYHETKRRIVQELISMSPKFYWRSTDPTLEDVRNFFEIALQTHMSYYYTIFVLQNVIKKGVKVLEELRSEKPFTMTEIYYAKVALRHLMHTFQCVKWVKARVNNELSPEVVINFFLQWIDPDNLYLDENVGKKLQELAEKVESILGFSSSVAQEKCAKGLFSERSVLAAVTQAIYHQRHMAVTSAANLETLNIIKVLDLKCGNLIVIAVIYHAIARRFGVNCELVVFPNHLFLEWRENCEYKSPKLYTVDISTGELHPKRQCPFSQANRDSSNFKYYPDSLLQYMYSSFHMYMGALKNWNSQNALYLLDFLGTYDNPYNPYRNFLPYLLDLTHLPAMDMELNLKYLSEGYQQILRSLSNLNTEFKTANRNMVVKLHDGRVKYAVGMICYHTKYDYVCVVRGWDINIEWQNGLEIDALDSGPNQPFYHVIAADQSERYVAQENLAEMPRPTRLYHLEDIIAREFTHFDGFSYVPNNEKSTEYPGEVPIRDTYRIRWYTGP